MTTIDFTRIRSAPKSRNDSFEALAVQLFREFCKAPVGSSFVSLRGDGGDGGVEAYYRTPTGEALGVQAKYFFKLDASELGQIATSLETALKNHPRLTEYFIYIPFDLTGRVAGGKRGKSQSERFEEWKEKVEGEAAKKGKALTVTLCTAAVIRSQLQQIDRHGGIRRYWFDEETLTTHQIEQCLAQAKAFVGPRYTAMLDIETNAHLGLDIFGGIGDYQAWYEKSVEPTLNELRSVQRYGDDSLNILSADKSAKARELIHQVIQSCEQLSDGKVPSSQGQNIGKDLQALVPLLTEASEAQEQAFYKTHGKNSDTPGFRQFHAEYMCAFPAGDMDAAREFEKACSTLLEVFSSPEFSAGTVHSLLLVGPAGIGKTHSIVSAAYRRLVKGGLSLVVFGDDFGSKEPWEVLRSKFGFGDAMGRDELFECLQASADNTGLPFVIYIDALNEGPVKGRWKDKLPEFIQQVKPYSGVKVCVSTRDTYLNQVVDARFPGLAFKHVGFSGSEFIALQAFAAYYDLDSEITPLFSAELRNPLFLQLACKALVAEGRRTLDVSLPGFTSLFESHLKQCDERIRARLHYVNPLNLARAAMLVLARILTESKPQERTWGACVDVLKNIVGSEISPETFLRELEHEGLVILSIDADEMCTVRMGYQRYGDTLRAIHRVESCIQNENLDMAGLAAHLAAITEDDEGLLEAIAVVLPERVNVEITKTELGLVPERAYQAYVHSLVWRSKDSFDSDTDVRLYKALSIPGLWQEVYEAFFSLSLVPKHRLNAKHWWQEFMDGQSMVSRDAFLSLAAYKSFDEKGAIRSLINSALKAEICRWPEESLSLAVRALGWLTSCADRRVRDMSAKGITRLLEHKPQLGYELVEAFRYCDDDYVRESICLAIYSACLLRRTERERYADALEAMLTLQWLDSSNVLIRDTIKLLAGLLSSEVALSTKAQENLAAPKKQPPPERWPVLEDAKPLLEIKQLPSNMKLWGNSLGPDFWRYKVESRIRSFDLATAGLTHENIACWIMVEALNLGYPGNDECALKVDHIINSEYGPGRGRPTYAERLGKKYYWIALHRLLGMLAENIPTKALYSDWKPRPDRLWSIDVRKVDLTDVRDIAPERTYPDEILQGPHYPFPPQSGDMKDWVRNVDFSPHQDCLSRVDFDEVDWVPLYLSVRDTSLAKGEDYWSRPYLTVDVFYKTMFVKRETVTPRFLREQKELSSSSCDCYRGYIAEYPDGASFKQLDEEGNMHLGQDGAIMGLVTLLRGGEWEYDFSCEQRPENLDVPCPDLIQVLGLAWDKQRGWVDEDEELVVFSATDEKRIGLFIRRVDLNKYLVLTGRALVFQRFANKGLINSAGDNGAQVDVHTSLLYAHHDGPKVLAEIVEPYNC